MHFSYECLNLTLAGVNLSNITDIFYNSEKYCRILRDVTPIFDFILHHVVMIPLVLGRAKTSGFGNCVALV